MGLVALYIRGQGANVLLPREVQASCSESPVLVHHVRHLGGEVVGSCHEHLSHVAAPGGRLFWAARGGNAEAKVGLGCGHRHLASDCHSTALTFRQRLCLAQCSGHRDILSQQSLKGIRACTSFRRTMVTPLRASPGCCFLTLKEDY